MTNIINSNINKQYRIRGTNNYNYHYHYHYNYNYNYNNTNYKFTKDSNKIQRNRTNRNTNINSWSKNRNKPGYRMNKSSNKSEMNERPNKMYYIHIIYLCPGQQRESELELLQHHHVYNVYCFFKQLLHNRKVCTIPMYYPYQIKQPIHPFNFLLTPSSPMILTKGVRRTHIGWL